MPLPRSDDSVHVYIIGHDDGPKKIGMSKDPFSRQKLLGVEGCRQVACLYHHEGFPRKTAKRIERHTHMILADKHVKGEWFDVTVDEAKAAINTAVAAARADEPLPLPKMKRLTIDVDPEFHLKLKTLALRERTTIADLARKQFVKMTKGIE